MNRKIKCTIVLLLLCSCSIQAQVNFSFSAAQVDSFTTGYYPSGTEGDTLDIMTAYVINHGVNPIILQWKMVTGVANRPDYWQFPGVADNWRIHTNEGDSLDYGVATQTAVIAPDDSSLIQVYTRVTVYDDSGIGHFYVCFYDQGLLQVDTIFFRLHKLNPALPRPSGIDPLTAGGNSVQLFPNPVVNTLWLDQAAGLAEARVQISDMAGRKCLAITRSKGQSPGIDISNLPPGMYLCRVWNREGRLVSSRKFLKKQQ